jgi:hypothetical protein
MENGYTVGELAHLVVPGTNAAEVAHVNRQLRHWTLTGVLKTLGVTHTGAGRHRKYSGDAVHVAALMVELSCLGLPVGTLSLLATGLMGVLRPVKTRDGKPLMDQGAAEKWRRAIRGDGVIYLTFNVKYGKRWPQSVGVAFYEADGPDVPSPITVGHVSAIVVDLTRLFEPLRQIEV